MAIQTVLTGITTSGTPHLGNWVGAIRPAIENSRGEDTNAYYFLADYHALIKNQNPELMKQSSMEIACTWLAMGIDTDKAIFYRQTDIPEIPELTWIFTCLTAKGLMNRSHAYKASIDSNENSGEKDLDKGVTMGLFCYPILMAADILMFNATKVPVGKDQTQHIEMARDIAGKFNHTYEKLFVLPEAVIDENTAVLSGLDGRKMSKSYNNTIPLFAPEKKLRKLINKIKTNSLEPGEPKEYADCTLFEIFSAFASKDEIENIKTRYKEGISWGEMKKFLFEYLNEQLTKPRKEYERLIKSPDYVEDVLITGAEKARNYSVPFIKKIRNAVGIAKIGF